MTSPFRSLLLAACAVVLVPSILTVDALRASTPCRSCHRRLCRGGRAPAPSTEQSSCSQHNFGGSFYFERQSPGTGTCGMHALNNLLFNGFVPDGPFAKFAALISFFILHIKSKSCHDDGAVRQMHAQSKIKTRRVNELSQDHLMQTG